MAIYHLHVKIIGRSDRCSVIAAAAYRAGEKLHNMLESSAYRSGETHESKGIIFDYSRKKGVVHTEIILPSNAPLDYLSRVNLWNAVEISEKRKNSQTAREVEIVLPKELNLQEQIGLIKEYIQDNFVNQGMIADFAIHDKNDGNPHVHILLTTRHVDKSGFGKKNRDWNNFDNVKIWRKNWEKICNNALEQKGIAERIDHRTLEAQGLDRAPTIHVGYCPKKKAKNDEIIRQNERFKPVNIARRMNDLSVEHNNLSIQIDKIREANDKYNHEILRIEYTIKEMQRRVEQVLKSQDEYAKNYFKSQFNIDPKDADLEVKRLKIKHIQLSHEVKNADLSPYLERARAIEVEYQKQRLLAEIRQDGAEILKLLGHSDSRLNRISEGNFYKILAEVRESQARLIWDRWRERQRVRERVRER